jgi:very-short-patch-repair endonuclease
MLAAALACGPNAVASHHASAALWGFIDYDLNRDPEVTVVGSSTRRHGGIQVHRTSILVPRDRSRAQDVPVTAPARTLVDLAATLDAPSLRPVMRRAQGLKLVNLRQLNEVLVRLAPRRGSGRLSKLIATGAAPTRSVLEDVVLDLLLEAGFEHPDVNKPLIVGGRRLIPDFRWPEQRLILEADGAAWHDDPLARYDDAERQAVLEAHGDRVIRITWHQAVARRAESIRRICAAGAPAARASSFSNSDRETRRSVGPWTRGAPPARG